MSNVASDLFDPIDAWIRDVSELFPGAGAAAARSMRAARETFDPSAGVGEPVAQPQDASSDALPHWGPHSLWLGALAGIVLAASSSAQSQAAPSLTGAWDMAPEASQFEERVVGPAPDQAVMMVTRDDKDHFSYELVESRGGVEVARGAYDLSFKGEASRSEAGGHEQVVIAAKDGAGDISIVAGGAGDYHAVVRLRQTGPNTALIEHVLEGPQGEIQLERFAMVRRDASGSTAIAAQAAAEVTKGGGD